MSWQMRLCKHTLYIIRSSTCRCTARHKLYIICSNGEKALTQTQQCDERYAHTIEKANVVCYQVVCTVYEYDKNPFPKNQFRISISSCFLFLFERKRSQVRASPC